MIADYYTKTGKVINIKFNKKGIKKIPGIVVGKGFGTFYPIRISISYNDLEKDSIYEVDFRLVKQINENVYNAILKNPNESNNNSYFNSDSD